MPATDRKDRLAAALRANLRRRKAQERGRHRAVAGDADQGGGNHGLFVDPSSADQPKSAEPERVICHKPRQ